MVKVELIRDLAQIAPVELDREHQASLFDRIEWFRRTWEHCPPGDAPLVAHAQVGNASVWLFLATHPRARAVALASWYTLAFRPVFTGAPDATTRTALLTAIARELRGQARRIILDHVPHDAASELAAAFEPARWLTFCEPQVAHWTVDVRGMDFATYWDARPGQLRSTVKRKGKKAALEIAILDRFDADVWAEYEAVYTNSWKPVEGSLAFLRATALAKGDSGRLRLGIARHEGRAVAAQFWTVEGGTAIIHKLAHRQGYDAISPGTLLSHAMFAHVIDVDRVDRIDFGTGDDGYKRDWMTDCEMLDRVTAYSLTDLRGIGGAARALAAQLVVRLRGRYRAAS